MILFNQLFAILYNSFSRKEPKKYVWFEKSSEVEAAQSSGHFVLGVSQIHIAQMKDPIFSGNEPIFLIQHAISIVIVISRKTVTLRRKTGAEMNQRQKV